MTGAKTWDELPVNARKFIDFIEGFVGVQVKYIGTGPGREDLIVRADRPIQKADLGQLKQVNGKSQIES